MKTSNYTPGIFVHHASSTKNDPAALLYTGIWKNNHVEVRFEFEKTSSEEAVLSSEILADTFLEIWQQDVSSHHDLSLLVQAAFESGKFYCKAEEWSLLRVNYYNYLDDYESELKNILHTYSYPSYIAEEYESYQEYEIALLETLEAMKAFSESSELNPFNPVKYRAIPQPQLHFLAKSKESRVILQQLQKDIDSFKESQATRIELFNAHEIAKKTLQEFYLSKEVFEEYLNALKQGYLDVTPAALKLYTDSKDICLYLWKIIPDCFGRPTSMLKIVEAPNEICTIEEAENAWHIINHSNIYIIKKTTRVYQTEESLMYTKTPSKAPTIRISNAVNDKWNAVGTPTIPKKFCVKFIDNNQPACTKEDKDPNIVTSEPLSTRVYSRAL